MSDRSIEPTSQEQSRFFLSSLTEKAALGAHAEQIYGAPIEREGVTVIPVAKARWFVAGGDGRGDTQESSSGGAGSLSVAPVGYIEVTSSGTRFKRFFDLASLVPIIGVSTVAIAVILAGTSKIIEVSRTRK